VIPISDGHALSIGVLTYRDSIHFAAYADPRALPEAGELRTLLSAAVTELDHSLGVQGRRRPRSAHARRRGARASEGDSSLELYR
jgi:hypothetical protein